MDTPLYRVLLINVSDTHVFHYIEGVLLRLMLVIPMSSII